jgi:hypothetical protein
MHKPVTYLLIIIIKYYVLYIIIGATVLSVSIVDLFTHQNHVSNVLCYDIMMAITSIVGRNYLAPL